MTKIKAKKNLSFTRLLKYISIIAMSLILFPLIYMSTVLIPLSEFQVIAYTVLCSAISVLGLVISELLVKFLGGKKALFVLARIGVLIVLGIIMFNVLTWTMSIVAIIAVFMGMFKSLFPLDNIKFISVGVVNIIQLIVFHFMDTTGNINLNVGVLFVFCILYFVYSNQSNINFLMERRSHKLEHLPSKIRVYNLVLVIGSLLILMVCITFSNEVFSFLLDNLYVFIKWLFQIIAWIYLFIVGIFTMDETDEEVVGSTESVEDEVVEEVVSSEKYYTEFMIAVFILFVIFYVYKNRKEIMEKLQALIAKITAFFQHVFADKAITNHTGELVEEYSDTVESLERESLFKNLFGAKKYNLRAWKKEYSAFSGMSNESQKIENGYTLIKNWITLAGVKISDNETPLEILAKTKSIITTSSWDDATDDYNIFKYAEREPNISEIEKVCKVLMDNKKIVQDNVKKSKK